MNLELDRILQPLGGSNADAKTASLRVMNDNPLTPQQRSEVMHHFALHQLNARASLAGFLTKDGQLKDGSKFRFVSNSGAHTLMVWPTGPHGQTALADLFFSVPIGFGDISYYDPKPSTIWKYRGKTDAPSKLHKSRVITDAPTIFQHPGNLTWFNAALKVKGKPLVASWWGRGTRYGRLDYYNHAWQRDMGTTLYSQLCSPASDYRVNWFNAFKPAVWLNGVKHRVCKIVADAKVDVRVISCGLRKVDGVGTYLYIVTNDTKLAVYRGLVSDPYDKKDIVVAHLFDLDFTVDTTPFSSGTPWWEGLLQPPYFNASCTKLTGLVAVKWNSTVNTSAVAALNGGVAPNPNSYYTARMEADLDAGTTSFDASAASFTSTVTSTHTGVLTTNEARSSTGVNEAVSYAAVDWIGDTLALAMVKTTITRRREETGSWTSSTMSKTATRYVSGSWRAFLAGSDETLGERSFAEVNVGTVHMESEQHDGGFGFPVNTGSGYRQETVSADILRFATIEGGDLRFKAPVICEVLEVGASDFYDTLGPTGNQAWLPQNRVDTTYSWGHMARTAVTSNYGRRDVIRLSLWRNGVEKAMADYALSSRSGRSSFGWIGIIITDEPDAQSDGVGAFFSWRAVELGETTDDTDTVGMDTLLSFTGRTDPVGSFSYGFGGPPGMTNNPIMDVGNPMANMTAFSTDGAYCFYQLSPGWNGVGSPSTATQSGIVIDGINHPVSVVALYPTSDAPILSVPVFIDRVPIQENK